MYDTLCKFIEWAKTYDTDNPDRSLRLHEQWIKTLPCPVFRINGTLSVNENVEELLRSISTFYPDLQKRIPLRF